MKLPKKKKNLQLDTQIPRKKKKVAIFFKVQQKVHSGILLCLMSAVRSVLLKKEGWLGARRQLFFVC